MPVQDKGPRTERRSEKPSLQLMILASLAFALLVALAVFVRDGFESLEEKLSYRLPTAAQAAGHGAYGIEIVDGQTIYVPVYSHIYADGGKPHLLETTLSIRNLDPDRAISVKSVKYFDTGGALVKEYLDGEMRLAALETAEFLVEKRNIRGGSGANFIVVWDAGEPVYEPLVEAVMVGFADTKSISFTSPGRALIARKEQTGSKP